MAIIRFGMKPETIAAGVVSVTVVAVTVNTSGVILQNYRLERDVRIMEKKVAIAEIELETQKNKNAYYSTDYYLDIAARKLLSKGAPGEKLIIVPREVALRELPPAPIPDTANNDEEGMTEESNLQLWGRFLRGKLY